VTVYKICDEQAWRACEAHGELPWSQDDVRDGFMHLSSAAQVPGTLARHFAGREGLWLLAVDEASLPALRWEPSRGGQLFPHLYGALPRAAIVRAAAIGSDALPDWLV
jgi:uncharacterized protein (DUF952 family)